jgi:hypothetical protein
MKSPQKGDRSQGLQGFVKGFCFLRSSVRHSIHEPVKGLQGLQGFSLLKEENRRKLYLYRRVLERPSKALQALHCGKAPPVILTAATAAAAHFWMAALIHSTTTPQ